MITTTRKRSSDTDEGTASKKSLMNYGRDEVHDNAERLIEQMNELSLEKVSDISCS